MTNPEHPITSEQPTSEVAWQEAFLAELRARHVALDQPDAIPVLLPILARLREMAAMDGQPAQEAAMALGRELAQAGREAGLAAEQLVVLARHGLDILAGRWTSATPWQDAFLQGVTQGLLRLETHSLTKKLREANRYVLQERRRYFSIFKRMAEPAFIIDHDLRFLETNRAFDQFFQLSGRGHIGKNCYQVLGEEFQAGCDLQAYLLQARGGIPRVEVRLRVAGEPRAVLVNGTFLGDINHDATGGIVILQDVTARRVMELALRESERQYRTLVENVPDVTWRLDSEGDFAFVSANAEAIYGFSSAELQGRASVRRLRIHPDDAEQVGREYSRFFLSHLPAGVARGNGLWQETGDRRPYDITFRFQRADGSWSWIHERACRLEERNGRWYADGVSSDVTVLKEAEAELELQNQRLEEMVAARTRELRTANQQLKKEIAVRRQTELALVDLNSRLAASNKELDQFAHVASHDLKEPLMLISAFSERLGRRYGHLLDDKGQEYLERIVTSTSQMRQLIDGLLSLSQVTSCARPYEEIDLEDLVREVLANLEERIEETHARIEIGSLGRLGGDRIQIRQLFQNIIANALKYRRPDAEPQVVLRGSLVDEGNYEILIQDNGIGFAPEDADRIFRPLERLHSRREYEGTGMGLTTCRKIVARHGGEILAHGQPGQGATFIIRLPVALRQGQAGEEGDGTPL